MSHQENGPCRRRKWAQWSVKQRVGVIVAAIILTPAFLALFAAVTMWLWNWLMPAIFKLPAITFWQAAGILILSHILFKGGHMRQAGRTSWKKAKIRNRMAEEGPQPTAQQP